MCWRALKRIYRPNTPCSAEDLGRPWWASRDHWRNPQPTAAMTTRSKHWSDATFPETLTDKNGTEQVPVIFNI